MFLQTKKKMTTNLLLFAILITLLGLWPLTGIIALILASICLLTLFIRLVNFFIKKLKHSNINIQQVVENSFIYKFLNKIFKPFRKDYIITKGKYDWIIFLAVFWVLILFLFLILIG